MHIKKQLLILCLFSAFFCLQAAETSTNPVLIEHRAVATPVKLTYIACAELPQNNFYEIDLKFSGKAAVTEHASHSELRLALAKKDNFCVVLKHPVSKKTTVLQVTFNAQPPTRSFGEQLPPYTDIRIYGTEKACPREIENLVLGLFAAPQPISLVAKIVSAVSATLFGAMAFGFFKKDVALEWWKDHGPVSRTRYYKKRSKHNKKQGELNAIITNLEKKKSTLEAKIDELEEAKSNCKSQLESTAATNQEQIARLTTVHQSLSAQLSQTQQKLSEAQVNFTRSQQELTAATTLFETQERALTSQISILEQQTLTTKRELAEIRTEHLRSRRSPATGTGDEGHATLNLAELAKHQFIKAKSKRSFVTLADLANQANTLESAIESWASSKHILILTYTELAANTFNVYKLLLAHREKLLHSFLLLNDAQKKAIKVTADPATDTRTLTQTETETEAILTSNIFAPNIQSSTIRPQVGPIKLIKLDESLGTTSSSQASIHQGFVDGRKSSQIRANLEALNNLTIHQINKFFDLGLEFGDA
jgi:hypothetical protein